MKNFNYYVTACRSTGEPLYFCTSATQGASMIPFAHSMAHRFSSIKSAREIIAKSQGKWKGLQGWKTNRELAA